MVMIDALKGSLIIANADHSNIFGYAENTRKAVLDELLAQVSQEELEVKVKK